MSIAFSHRSVHVEIQVHYLHYNKNTRLVMQPSDLETELGIEWLLVQILGQTVHGELSI